MPFILYLFLGWGFVLAAAVMTALTLGAPAIVTLLRRYLMWRVHWRWYVAALGIALLQLLGLVLAAGLAGSAPEFSHVLADQLRPPSFSRLAFVIRFLLTDAID